MEPGERFTAGHLHRMSPGDAEQSAAGVPGRIPPAAPLRHADGAANELSAALWEERRHLAAVLAALHQADSLPPGGTPERSALLLELRTAGLARDIAARVLASAWGMPDDTPLPELILGAPDGPWPFIFGSHLDAIRDLVSRIDGVQQHLSTDPQGPDGARPLSRENSAPVPRQLLRFLGGPCDPAPSPDQR
ncbi:hypothetical protein QK292_03820 [Arthrobacter sp. AL08]|uniref:hypothetical protein n=1 Tax=unclassified Arthrobacter TaxID=235627 RepID=UPI001D000D5F|nr:MULTISPECIES: hypothetical protein [unclassified Arthrobacter]MCB5281586.1 hypothetical protein [Arthrobacter sp. ES1]MDI3240691.1 hypothetical protein [Arthrobacter sp. AL05]MDI3276701.1 hypothetical protein [Arthrobacter sp. AL08]WGZ80390.1 hypothetical protein QI450_04000 [Arthrobacter sp. EM1]